MSRKVSNVNVIQDSFEVLILKVNESLNALSTEVITANGTYANTGNTSFPRVAQLYGTFGSNNLIVTNSLRGGNVNGQSANLTINSNVVVSTESNFRIGSDESSYFIDSTTSRVGNTLQYSISNNSSYTITNKESNNTLLLNTGEINLGNSTLSTNISSNSIETGKFVTNSTGIYFGSNTVINTTKVELGISNNNILINSNNVIVTNLDEELKSNSSGIYISNDQSSVASYEKSGYRFDNLYSLITEYKENLGSNSSRKEIFRFNKDNFTSGKLQIQIINGTSSQISEVLLTHNQSSVSLTTYGSVSSPQSSNSESLLGTISATLDNSNIIVLLDQSISNSKTKTIAHMIV